jgi:hypothetical protein
MGIFFVFFFFLVLDIKLTALCMLGKCFTIELHHSPRHFLKDSVSLLQPRLPETHDPPTSAFQELESQVCTTETSFIGIVKTMS